MKNLNISLIGSRGIPARYGGFEKAVEEIGSRLVNRGHKVSVYCRTDNPSEMPTEYKGVTLVHMPKLRQSFVATPFNSLLACVDSALSHSDVLHFFGGGTIPFLAIPRVLGGRIVLTVDGLEWQRQSYSVFSRLYLRSFAELGAVIPHTIVADSKSTVRWYHSRTGRSPRYIPYGVNVSSRMDMSVLKEHGLLGHDFILFIGRLVREKGVHDLIEAFRDVSADVQLVIVGGSPRESRYSDMIKDAANERVKFLGYVYGQELETIRNAALVYVQPSLLEGTSISLLDAIGAGRCIILSDLPENRDVAGDAAVYFEVGNPQDLSSKISALLEDRSRIEEMSRRARKLAEQFYSWDSVVTAYEEIYRELTES